MSAQCESALSQLFRGSVGASSVVLKERLKSFYVNRYDHMIAAGEDVHKQVRPVLRVLLREITDPSRHALFTTADKCEYLDPFFAPPVRQFDVLLVCHQVLGQHPATTQAEKASIEAVNTRNLIEEVVRVLEQFVFSFSNIAALFAGANQAESEAAILALCSLPEVLFKASAGLNMVLNGYTPDAYFGRLCSAVLKEPALTQYMYWSHFISKVTRIGHAEAFVTAWLNIGYPSMERVLGALPMDCSDRFCRVLLTKRSMKDVDDVIRSHWKVVSLHYEHILLHKSVCIEVSGAVIRMLHSLEQHVAFAEQCALIWAAKPFIHGLAYKRQKGITDLLCQCLSVIR